MLWLNDFLRPMSLEGIHSLRDLMNHYSCSLSCKLLLLAKLTYSKTWIIKGILSLTQSVQQITCGGKKAFVMWIVPKVLI